MLSLSRFISYKKWLRLFILVLSMFPGNTPLLENDCVLSERLVEVYRTIENKNWSMATSKLYDIYPYIRTHMDGIGSNNSYALQISHYYQLHYVLYRELGEVQNAIGAIENACLYLMDKEEYLTEYVMCRYEEYLFHRSFGLEEDIDGLKARFAALESSPIFEMMKEEENKGYIDNVNSLTWYYSYSEELLSIYFYLPEETLTILNEIEQKCDVSTISCNSISRMHQIIDKCEGALYCYKEEARNHISDPNEVHHTAYVSMLSLLIEKYCDAKAYSRKGGDFLVFLTRMADYLMFGMNSNETIVLGCIIVFLSFLFLIYVLIVDMLCAKAPPKPLERKAMTIEDIVRYVEEEKKETDGKKKKNKKKQVKSPNAPSPREEERKEDEKGKEEEEKRKRKREEEERRRREEEKEKKREEEKRMIEEERKKIEEEKRKIEEERKKMEKERKKMEEEKRRIEKEEERKKKKDPNDEETDDSTNQINVHMKRLKQTFACIRIQEDSPKEPTKRVSKPSAPRAPTLSLRPTQASDPTLPLQPTLPQTQGLSILPLATQGLSIQSPATQTQGISIQAPSGTQGISLSPSETQGLPVQSQVISISPLMGDVSASPYLLNMPSVNTAQSPGNVLMQPQYYYNRTVGISLETPLTQSQSPLQTAPFVSQPNYSYGMNPFYPNPYPTYFTSYPSPFTPMEEQSFTYRVC